MNRTLKIASDGSVQEHRASFAWVIATEEGVRLATCSGPAYGCKPTSYGAEGYGILSTMRFITVAKQHWGNIRPCRIVCNNEAIVQQFHQAYDPIKIQPNHTMIAEWDILVEIWKTMRT
jgi:hypothetical protein